jgi:hypothetical protein
MSFVILALAKCQPYQGRTAIRNLVTYQLIGQVRLTLFFTDTVQGVGHVRCGINQGAIQVKEDCAHRRV